MTTPLAATEAERLEREAFEKEYGPRDGFAWRNENGTYKIASLQLAWEIWWKARAMQQTAEPVPTDIPMGYVNLETLDCAISFYKNEVPEGYLPFYLAAPARAPSTDSAADALTLLVELDAQLTASWDRRELPASAVSGDLVRRYKAFIAASLPQTKEEHRTHERRRFER